MPKIEAEITLDQAIDAMVQAVGDASYNYFKWSGSCEFTVWQAEQIEAAARLIRQVLEAEQGRK